MIKTRGQFVLFYLPLECFRRSDPNLLITLEFLVVKVRRFKVRKYRHGGT